MRYRSLGGVKNAVLICGDHCGSGQQHDLQHCRKYRTIHQRQGRIDCVHHHDLHRRHGGSLHPQDPRRSREDSAHAVPSTLRHPDRSRNRRALQELVETQLCESPVVPRTRASPPTAKVKARCTRNGLSFFIKIPPRSPPKLGGDVRKDSGGNKNFTLVTCYFELTLI